MSLPNDQVQVSSEIGRLRRLLIHSPDSGLGKVVPSKAQDWLFEDIVHLDVLRTEEYDYYLKILLYFLDPEKVKGKLKAIDAPENKRNFYKPGHPDFHASRQVIELQALLAGILQVPDVKSRLIASVCAVERCSYVLQEELMEVQPVSLANILITGSLEDGRMIFPPIPNFIFTRDIGIIINKHILLNKPAKKARYRESVLAKYIFFHHPLFTPYRENIIEIPDNVRRFLLPKDESELHPVTLEGGDVMIVSPDHLLIGWSERTSPEAIHQTVNLLFEKQVVNKITVIGIPKKRDFMHIDTIFTQVKRDVWVLLDTLSDRGRKPEAGYTASEALPGINAGDRLKITQLYRDQPGRVRRFEDLEDLLDDISRNELGSAGPTRFIYSGNREFPFNEREQWSDSCNLLALKEGVVIGYDRNDRTAGAFREHGFDVVRARDLLERFEKGESSPESLEDTLILLPSAELSRARGGSHCMSLPVLRSKL